MRPRINIPTLPYEIWWKIAGFLPLEEIKRLYSVNRPFFDASLKERYCFADIGGPSQTFQRLEDKRLAKYVQELYLRPVHVEGSRIRNIRSGWRKWTEMLSNTLQKINPMRRSLAPSFTGTAPPAKVPIDFKIIHNLAFVTRLKVGCTESEYRSPLYIPFLIFLSVGWDSFGSNLQALRLSLPLGAIYDILTANPVTLELPDLRELVLEVWTTSPPQITYLPDRDGTQSITATDTLLPFISNHSDTLRTLTLHSWDSDGGMYLPLGKLSHMPILDSFATTVFGKADCSALHDFLSSYSHQLKNLAIRLALGSVSYEIPSESWSQHPCFRVELRELCTLSLDGHLPDPRHAAGAVNYVLQYSTQLTSLELKAGRFSYAQVNDLINGFAVGAKLRKLHFSTNYLSPELLRLLSTKLPDLQNLSIKFLIIIPWKNMQGSMEAEGRAQLFCEEMKKIYVPEWAVQSLVTSPLGYAKNLQVRTALATAFPNILMFNGLERKQYLTPSGSNVRFIFS